MLATVAVSVVGLLLVAVGLGRWARKIPKRLWGPVMIRFALTRLEVCGAENLDPSRAYCFVANHRSMLDIAVLLCAVPGELGFVAKAELRKIPVMGAFMAALGMVFVDRGRHTSAMKALGGVAELAAEGRSVAAFPEGTRHVGDELAPFKKGMFVAAIGADLPIVPVALIGTDRVMPNHGFRPRPGVVRVVMGEPIETTDLALEDRNELIANVRERIRSALDEPHEEVFAKTD